jgi:uncharacterized protein
MYHLLLYDLVNDYLERRGEFRAEHLELARQASERGELLLGGAFSDPVDGAALLFEADDRSVPERFAREDPYVKAGLVTHWRVRGWTVVAGCRADAAAP